MEVTVILSAIGEPGWPFLPAVKGYLAAVKDGSMAHEAYEKVCRSSLNRLETYIH